MYLLLALDNSNEITWDNTALYIPAKPITQMSKLKKPIPHAERAKTIRLEGYTTTRNRK